jgi:integrase
MHIEERANYKPSSIAAYKSILKKYLLPEFGSVSIKEITDSELRKFQVRISKTVSPSRVNTVVQLLRSILGQEYREGNIRRDPSLGVRRMQEPKVHIDPLSEDELEIALAMIADHYKPLFLTLAFTGARPNELCALRWTDIDWNGEYISITKGRVRGQEGLPKTKSAERNIPLLPRVIESLKALKTKSIDSIGGYVFTTPKGNPIEKHLDKIWSRALKRGGLRHRPSYQLRHTFATMCIVHQMPLPYISKILGHSTIDSLVRNYAGWISNATKEYDAKLKDAFSKNLAGESSRLKKMPGVFPGV